MYYGDNMYRNQDQQVVEAILGAIKREASVIALYRQLANAAPDYQKNDIIHALEGKKNCITQFTNLYISLTGTQPVYEIDHIPFRSYRDGLQKAYASELESYNEYQHSSLLTQHPQIRNVFLGADRKSVV